ncbi:alpha/beta fold hydrolase [Mucilaginibacter lappiensis]|uniref:Pimeloyl-ACP methyl ester carboxylesterase n=1 Tax=Mucilaginibacter lappiensis TaxID=354630 RepID=A0A1N7FX88_9SPHI|nr:alpha/beta hydrolase [Mucilaginibacter lappiensis]MBB6112620.1 pimeloyl-ACP methyl ester carboxylesterase [Mucilaginibacter lappiensis]MBB6126649.1 pimeloyl-ACP methyl ester carboxylesterase [Mucilaginibacter lappiensis]SIS04929.1 Pimeloyl-ACP methyl ester carboxylesterase [Mucilaginibacter lappiensis]
MTEKESLNTTELKHGMAVIDNSLRIHYVEAGSGEQTIVLLHGFPQTWWEWRFIIPELAEAGFRVIAIDYRGAGDSWRPATGYDKRTMAGDIYKVLKEHLKIEEPVIMAGHDIGLMVAYAYAQEYREDVSRLIVIDAPLPGTLAFDKIRSDHRVWHFAFHGVRDLPEFLIAGREREYLQAFFNYRIFNVGAISKADMDIFTSAYSAPGAIRAGLEVYRAFDQDINDNRESLQKNGKLSIPVLAIGGEISTSGTMMGDMMREVADNVVAVRILQTAHWVAEENPDALLSEILKFLN